jgi:hypothetical protein
VWLLAGLSVPGVLQAWRWWRVRGGTAVPVRSSPRAESADQHRRAASYTRRERRLPRGTILALAIAVLTLGPALCYPAGWDELVYHVALPRRWLADGRPAFYADLPYSGFPSSGEVLFWLMAPLECVIAPRLLAWACWVLALVMSYRLLRRHLLDGPSVLLTTVFAVSPATLMVSANCYVEAIVLLNVAAILLAVASPERRAPSAPRRAAPVVLGVLAGGAAAVKLTGTAVLALPLLWYIGAAWHDRSQWRAAARSAAACLAVAACVAFPFYLRPWLQTGNPFYPYFAEWFSDDPALIETSRYHHAIAGSKFGVRSVGAFVAGPLLMVLNERAYDGSFGWQAVGLIALGVLAVLAAERSGARGHLRRVVAWPAAGAVVTYSVWFATAQQARFAVPAALIGMPCAGLGLRILRCNRPARSPLPGERWIPSGGSLTCALALTLMSVAAVISLPWRTAGYYLGSWETVAGWWTWTEYVDDGTDYEYMPLVRAIGALPAGARLMVLFEHRGLYLPRPHVIGTPFFQPRGFSPPEEFGDAERVLAALQRDGITHVVMTRAPAGPDHSPEWSERLTPLLRSIGECVRNGGLRIAWESEKYLLFQVSRG